MNDWIDRGGTKGNGSWLGRPKKRAPRRERIEPEAAGGEAVIYYPIRCPKCRSKNTRVTSTVKPVRYHKCDNCGYSFKSVESA